MQALCELIKEAQLYTVPNTGQTQLPLICCAGFVIDIKRSPSKLVLQWVVAVSMPGCRVV